MAKEEDYNGTLGIILKSLGYVLDNLQYDQPEQAFLLMQDQLIALQDYLEKVKKVRFNNGGELSRWERQVIEGAKLPVDLDLQSASAQYSRPGPTPLAPPSKLRIRLPQGAMATGFVTNVSMDMGPVQHERFVGDDGVVHANPGRRQDIRLKVEFMLDEVRDVPRAQVKDVKLRDPQDIQDSQVQDIQDSHVQDESPKESNDGQ